MVEAILFLILPFTACVCVLALLAYLGMHVLEREIIFIDIALAQICAVGATFAHVFMKVEEHSLLAYICAFMFTVIAAGFFSQIDKRITQISHEGIIGVSYAIAAAAALFILALAAGGDVHVEHMLTGRILWAEWSDIFLIAAVYIPVGLFHWFFREKFKCLSEDYKPCRQRDRKAVLWDFLFYVTMGLVITVSVRIAGVLVIFSFLIIPATFSAIFSQSWKTRIRISWVMGLAAITGGLAFSYVFDFSCGPSVVSVLGIILIGGALFSRIKVAFKSIPDK